jgi:methionyl-tRNA synthetase
VVEENWFFRLSRYAPRVRALITDGALRIEPEERRNEVLGFLAGDVRDVSVSRPAARVGGWGIPVPDEADQLVYVWFDALANYVSAPGIAHWCEAGARRHVIGKGIVRFHAVIWPAILCSAGLPLPDELFVHDYVTARGRKIGKSLGNAVDPGALVERYGADALRWWLAREVPRIGETDFTQARLVECVNRDLANGVGNLVQRVVKLAAGIEKLDAAPATAFGAAGATAPAVDAALTRFDIRRGAEAVVELVAATNRYLEQTAPWTRTGAERAVLVATALHATRTAVAELGPFTPDLAARAKARLETLEPGPPLVRRLG